jgi:hypothetical protein
MENLFFKQGKKRPVIRRVGAGRNHAVCRVQGNLPARVATAGHEESSEQWDLNKTSMGTAQVISPGTSRKEAKEYFLKFRKKMSHPCIYPLIF